MSEQQAPPGAFSIHVFPYDDLALETAVRRTIKRLLDSPTPPEGRLDRAVAQLRRLYPDLVIRQRDALAELVEETTVWYVYRDGGLLHDHVLPDDHPRTAVVRRRSAVPKVTRSRAECFVCGACHWSRSSDRVIAVWKDAGALTDYVHGPDRGNSNWTCDECGLQATAPVAALLSEVSAHAQA